MWPEGSGDQAEAADEQDQHHQGVEEAGALEIDVHVGDHAGEDEERAGNGEKPADEAATVPEEQAHPEEHGHQRDTKRVRSVKTPVGARYAHLVRKKVAAQTNHDESERESAKPARRAANISHSAIFHAPENTKPALLEPQLKRRRRVQAGRIHT